MHAYIYNALLNSSIAITALAGLIRFKFIDKVYYPFIILIWLGFLNEALSITLAYRVKSNSFNSNIYILLEYLLILLQFRKWENNPPAIFYFCLTSGFFVWILDDLILHSLRDNNSIFRIYYSFVIIFFSINQVNKIIIYEKGVLLKNAVFLICISFLMYYSCKTFVEIFNAFHLGLSNEFNRNIFMIMYVANLLSNIIYTLAILCMPPKQEFSMPY